jgi:hypothetical protein
MSVGIVRISEAGRQLLQRALDHGGRLVLRSTRDAQATVDEAGRLYDLRIFDAKRFERGGPGRERRWTYELSEAGEVVARTICAP